jgi:nucleoside 2-deoxyribosyltransferase
MSRKRLAEEYERFYERPKRTVYLAHTLGTRKYVKEKIQPILEQRYHVMNPFRDRKFDERATEQEIREKMHEDKEIVERDLQDIHEADLVIAFLKDGPSYGTVMEIAYSVFVEEKECIVFVPETDETHPWLRYLTQLHNINEFEELMR